MCNNRKKTHLFYFHIFLYSESTLFYHLTGQNYRFRWNYYFKFYMSFNALKIFTSSSNKREKLKTPISISFTFLCFLLWPFSYLVSCKYVFEIISISLICIAFFSISDKGLIVCAWILFLYPLSPYKDCILMFFSGN